MERTLSDDVRLVIDTLGFVIRAHAGDEVFAAVEAVRLAAKEARESDDAGARDHARDRLASLVGGMDAPTALEVARAFTLYFQLVNLAEDAQRTRELRRREVDAGPASVRDSIHGVLNALADKGASRDDVLAALRSVRLTFVFTAHPTEARRQTTERLLSDVARVLRRRDRQTLTPLEVAATDRRLRAAIEALFQHAAVRLEPPEVLDEVRAGLWYLRHVLLDAVPRFQRRLHNAFEARFGPIDVLDLPMTVRFGSWMGGDRDGNPFVTADVTAQTLALHRELVLKRYQQDVVALIDPLAAADHRLRSGAALDQAWQRLAAAVPDVAKEATQRNPHEPLRRVVSGIAARLDRARRGTAGAYADPSELLDDLMAIRQTLQAAHATALPDDELTTLIGRVRCFGFHLVSLDVREDSRVHRMVIGKLLDDDSYPQKSVEARVAALETLALPGPDAPAPAPEVARLLALFAMLRHGTYIISMTESIADVLEVHRLAELFGIADHIDIVPLLETPDDLAQAGPLLEALFSHPGYAAHLEQRQRTQELLVGYSDSMKQGGMLASRVAVAEAQRAAAVVCRRHGIRLRVFHGRGGSVSRGGGPTHRAILALPREAFDGETRITEQGEMRAANFANPDLAVRYLEQAVGAAVWVCWRARKAPTPPDRAREAATLQALAVSSRQAYRRLIEDPRLVPYYLAATPFEHIAGLNIGSRPSRRAGGVDGIGSLRAIPWVFGWSQSRHVLTGWFGVGSALTAALARPDGERWLRELYRSSRFVQDLIDNVEMAMAKTDLPIAARYADLCQDPDVRTLFDVIAEEFERTRVAVLTVTCREELLAEDPVLSRSIRLRNPYVDPLSYLQVEAMRRLRSSTGAADAEAQTAWALVARVTVQGIAAGIRHTG